MQQKNVPNDVFITLIRAAEEFPDLAQRILAITRLPDPQRKSMIQQLIIECREDDAPEEFIQAIACLGDHAIAAKINEHLADS